MKRLSGIFVLLGLVIVLLTACGGPPASGPNPVHMNSVDFLQPSITIKKGEIVTLINDEGTVHYIANGTWDNGMQKAEIEPGAPKVDIQVGGNASSTLGPFNTAGTFKLYCTIHPNMKLTVTVK
ncbi:MAG: hypothetical protein H0U76_00280 [Ktedonobacteraceae bacterium]|nr:hypothetical protein [Ktedonobacteraceae bacterium]